MYALDASIIHGDEVNVSNASQTGIFATGGSTIQAFNAIANECSRGAVAEQSSTLNVQALKAENCTSRALRSAFNSRINARNSELNFSGWYGVDCAENSTINMQNSNVIGSMVRGIDISGGSTVNASVCVVSETQPGNAVAHGIFVSGNSRLNLGTSRIVNNGGKDVVIESGSFVTMPNCYTTESYGTGERVAHINDVNVNAFNALTNFGVIFR